MLSTGCLDYLENLRFRNCTAYTLRGYSQVLTMTEAALGKPMLEATREDIETYMAGRSRLSLKPQTIAKHQNILRSFYKWALKMERRDTDPTIRLEAPKPEKRLPIHLTRPHIDTLFAVLKNETRADKREAAVIKTFYYTGMRAIELGRLTFDDLYLDGDAPTVRVFGKGNKERLIPVADELLPTLWAWLSVHPTGHGHVFTDLLDGGPICYDTIRRIVKGAMERAGLGNRKFTCHKLRHTFATHLINGGVPINEIQQLMGHASIATTQIYAHTQVNRNALKALKRTG